MTIKSSDKTGLLPCFSKASHRHQRETTQYSSIHVIVGIWYTRKMPLQYWTNWRQHETGDGLYICPHKISLITGHLLAKGKLRDNMTFYKHFPTIWNQNKYYATACVKMVKSTRARCWVKVSTLREKKNLIHICYRLSPKCEAYRIWVWIIEQVLKDKIQCAKMKGKS